MVPVKSKPNDKREFVHKRIGRAIGGFVTGGVTGAAAGFLRSSRRPSTRVRGSRSRAFELPRAPAPVPRSLSVVRSGGLRAFAQRTIPGGATGFEVATSGGCPQGFHPNKSDYMTKDGFVEEGTKCVRNRRRNLSNGRANTRALRRMAAWDKQERKLGKTLKAIARGR